MSKVSKIRKKKIRQLRRGIEELNEMMKGAATVEEWDDINAAELYQREFLEEDLRVLERIELEEQARPFGIDLYPSEGRWGDALLWENTRDGRRMLTEQGWLRGKKLITDARMDYWKRWTDIVAPIASTIISIIALIVAVIALYR
jgi:hypothetical protein